MSYTEKIVHLPKEIWKGTVLPIGYMADECYEVEKRQAPEGFSFTFRKIQLETPVTHMPEEYDFPDKLYEAWWEGACAWGVLEDGKLIAAIETCPETWSNRLRVTELWVDAPYRGQGIGHALMETAKEQAHLENRRAVILETQSCNVNAIDFYRHEGFTLIGCDICAYSNRDIARREVRMELGWFPPRRDRLSRSDIEIRAECPKDYDETEQMVRRAFWNKYRKGCNEHYFVHMMRKKEEYLPSLSRIAVKDGTIVGGIFYTRATVRKDALRHEVLTFGPLCVLPEWQGCGIGEMLLRETMKLAAAEGYPGIIIFGIPEYYPRFGFQSCEKFGITDKDGKNDPAFMGIELSEGAMREIDGVYHEPEFFEMWNPEELERYDRHFPPLKKQYFPAQWTL